MNSTKTPRRRPGFNAKPHLHTRVHDRVRTRPLAVGGNMEATRRSYPVDENTRRTHSMCNPAATATRTTAENTRLEPFAHDAQTAIGVGTCRRSDLHTCRCLILQKTTRSKAHARTKKHINLNKTSIQENDYMM